MLMLHPCRRQEALTVRTFFKWILELILPNKQSPTLDHIFAAQAPNPKYVVLIVTLGATSQLKTHIKIATSVKASEITMFPKRRKMPPLSPKGRHNAKGF